MTARRRKRRCMMHGLLPVLIIVAKIWVFVDVSKGLAVFFTILSAFELLVE
jgi:hypothetical protein